MDLYKEYKTTVLRIATKQFPKSLDIEGAVDDAFVKAIPSWDASKGPFLSWVMLWVRSYALQGKQKTVYEDIDEVEVLAAEPVYDTSHVLTVRKAVARLSKEDKEILQERTIEGETLYNIAKARNTSIPSIVRRYEKALKHLREEMQK